MWGLYCLLLWAGYARLPMVPIVADGPILQDPPLSMARGQGMVAPSLAGTIGLERLWAHYPPVYFWLQALVYSILGLSPLALRLVSLLAAMGAAALALGCFREMRRLELVETRTQWLMGLLVLTEPLSWTTGRWERMESLLTMLGLAAIWILLRGVPAESRPPRARLATGAGAALMMGLCLSTHWAAVLAYLFYLLILFGQRTRLGFQPAACMLFALAPPALLVILWVVAHQDQSLAAYQQLRLLLSNRETSWVTLFARVQWANLTPKQLLQWGPFALGECFLAWGVGLAALGRWRQAGAEGAHDRRAWLLPLWVGLTLALFQILCLGGYNPRRLALLLPFALLVWGLGLRYLSPRAARNLRGIAYGFAACGALAIGLHLAQAVRQWDQRSPNRLAPLLASLPPQARLAAASEFWYPCQRQDRPMRLIATGFQEDRKFWFDRPDAFRAYDVVIVEPNDEAVPLIAPRFPYRCEVTVGTQQYSVFTRAPYGGPGNPPGGPVSPGAGPCPQRP